MNRSGKRIVNARLRNRMNKIDQLTIDPPKMEETEQIEITVEKPEERHAFAGFWMRFWAFLLDLLVIFGLKGLTINPLMKLTDIDFWGIQTLLSAAVFFLYFAIMTKMFGQTVGKMILGLKVIAKHDNELTWTQIIFREGVGRIMHQIFFFLYILYVTVAFTGKKQGLHDMIADTYVVLERNR